MPRTVHIIGAGLAGLAAAVRLSDDGVQVVVHEATGHPGGRCRSYYDHATGLTIDNGNHLLLSANHAALSYLRAIGTEDRLVGPAKPEFDFIDLGDGARWTLRISEGRAPWWIFDSTRRVPGSHIGEYLRLLRLLRPHPQRTVGETIACSGPLYEKLVRPLLLAALNTEPSEGSAALAGAIVRETLAAGGKACRPLIARDGLGEAFIEPAVAHVEQRGGEVKLRHELRALRFDGARVSALDFGEGVVELGADDAVILAVPPFAATLLVPELSAPTTYRAIVNAHFRVDPPTGFPAMIGVLNGTAEWIFSFRGRLSVTISCADRLLATPRGTLADMIWRDIARTAGLSGEMPPWQIVRERRATFAATPQENAKRPPARTRWANLLLAGDWIDTGLPATIESAIRSGQRAADLVNQGPTTRP
jgi:squalene-associated FAD-dependent desaturase